MLSARKRGNSKNCIADTMAYVSINAVSFDLAGFGSQRKCFVIPNINYNFSIYILNFTGHI